MDSPKLLTVILNYKTPDMTLQSVEAALREMDGIKGRLIVVDNDSQDSSFEKLQQGVAARGWDQGGRVQVLQSGHNGGFGAGNNFGIIAGLKQDPSYDFIYILNSDAFPDQGAITALIKALRDNPEVGFAGSYIHGPEGDPHETSFRFPGMLSEFEGAMRFGPVSKLLANYAISVPIPERTQRVDWLAGASMMMRRDVLAEIGLFDEHFFLYFEETDLCLRATKAGHPVLFVRESSVTHIGSVSTGMKTWTRMPRYWFASRKYYFSKNYGAAYALLVTLAHTTAGVLWRIRRRIQKKPQADPDHFLRDMLAYDLSHFPKHKNANIPEIPDR
ncbi:MAG: glycosyl transferase [Rhodobacterales bacterium]|nr:MAG: glycosyl transferase [Rhodobacterales bacterium]